MVNLTVTGLPDGVVGWLSTQTVTLTDSSGGANKATDTLYLCIGGQLQPGVYTLTITGTLGDPAAGGQTGSATVTLTVTQASAEALPNPAGGLRPPRSLVVTCAALTSPKLTEARPGPAPALWPPREWPASNGDAASLLREVAL